MTFEKFTDGNHFTIGVELELRILDRFELTPQNEFDFIVENIDKKYRGNLAKEFLGSMVEINTPIFHYVDDLIKYLNEILEELSKTAAKKNLVLQTSGTFAQKNTNIKINSNDRYEKLYDEHKILLDDFAICGTHVHIGFEDFDKALKAYNYSLYYLPLLLALSASSVYNDGIDTGIHSYRTKIFSRLPKASIPDYFDSYEDMKALYDLLEQTDVIQSTKDIWWDVRIQPHFRTVEFRVCDAINDFDKLEVIIALFKIICQLSQTEDVIKMPMQVLKQNMWSATRYSMEGKMVTIDGLKTIREVLNEIVDKAYEKTLINKEKLQKAKKIIKQDSISKKMVEAYNRTKNLKEVERLGVFDI